ncbi:hypothetical protein BH10ACI3_BH10ACI3_01870 [soil metagenome]
MPKTIEKETCSKCEMPVRENTQFCYNCGSRVTNSENGSEPVVNVAAQAALDDLAVKLKGESDSDEKLAKAAAERKKARVGQRKSKEFVWQPKDDVSSGFVMLVAVVITILAAAIVFGAVYWR